MNIERGFKFVFQEKNWLAKVVVGGLMILFSFLIIPLLIYLGYLIEVTKRVIKSEEQLLPDWDNIGRKISNGFKFLVVIIVYLIPLFLLLALSAPFFKSDFNGFRGREIVAMLYLGDFSWLFLLSAFVYLILLYLAFPFIVGKYAENESLNDAFAISDISKMLREYFGDAVIVFLLMVFVQILASLGVVFFFIGVIFTGFWANVVVYYLYGELYSKATRKV
jgi:hypothetical protein